MICSRMIHRLQICHRRWGIPIICVLATVGLCAGEPGGPSAGAGASPSISGIDGRDARAPRASGDWPQWRGGPQRSGAVAEAAILTELAAGADLVEAWRSEALPSGYGPQNACVVGQGSPVIAERAVFLYVNWPDDTSVTKVGRARIPERVDDVLLCVDLATGQTRWRFAAPGKPWRWGISSTPAVASGAVVFVGSTGDGICLDAGTGKERWRWRNPKPPKPGYTDVIGPWHASALIVDGCAVFIGAGKHLVACDLKTGAVRWSKPAGKDCWSSPSAWFRQEGWVLLANGQAWNPADGTALWPDKPKGWSHGWSTPAIEGDRVAVMGGAKGLLVGQMSDATVRIVAEVELPNGGGNAAIVKGRVYACGGRSEGKTDTGKPKHVGHVVAIEAATGALLWDTACPDLGGVGGQWSFVSVCVANDVVAVLGGGLHLLKASDGTLLREALKLDVLKGGVSLALGAECLVTRGWKNLVCYRATRKTRLETAPTTRR